MGHLILRWLKKSHKTVEVCDKYHNVIAILSKELFPKITETGNFDSSMGPRWIEEIFAAGMEKGIMEGKKFIQREIRRTLDIPERG